MTDTETVIMIKNMAREMVNKMTVKNALDKNTVKKIVAEIKKGKDIEVAMDAVMGKGSYKTASLDELSDIRSEMRTQLGK